MAMGFYRAILNGLAQTLGSASDSNGTLYPAHVVVDQNGVPVSVAAPFPTADATAGGYLASIATNTVGVATAAGQATGNTSLASIATNTVGVATAAGQATGNTSLASIATSDATTATNTTTIAGAVSSGRMVIAAPLSYSSSTSGTVAATSGTLVSAGAFTHTLQIWNNGTATIWLNPTGSAAVVGAGAPIPAGGALIFGAIDLPIPTAAITAISSLGSVSVSIVGG